MSDNITYHRTFAPATTCPSCHKPERRPPLPDPFTMSRPVAPAPPKPNQWPTNVTGKRHRALKYSGTGLSDIEIIEKIDQDFKQYATEWEKRFSALLVPCGFTPIVDDTLQVVGYLYSSASKRASVWTAGVPGTQVTYSGRDLKKKTETVFRASAYELKDLLDQDHPVYVDDRRPPGPWLEFWENLRPMIYFDAICAVDGQILGILNIRSGPGLISVDPPWDTIMMYVGLVSLGAHLGDRLVKSVIRRTASAVRALRGPLKELAERATARFASRVLRGESKAFIPKSGMTGSHFASFQAAAAEEEVIAVVRLTNPKSTPLIAKGAQGKPKDLEFLKTSADDGIVSVSNSLERFEVFDKGYFVVGENNVARRLVRGDVRNGTAVFDEVKLTNANWQVRPGQVLDKDGKLPLVGDYDLMGVIKPSNTGQNIALVASEGKMLPDWSNPTVRRFADTVNSKMGPPKRVLHGAQDNYGGFRGGAVAFFPDGTVKLLEDEHAVEAFYQAIKRETRAGSYGVHVPPPDGNYPPLRLVK